MNKKFPAIFLILIVALMSAADIGAESAGKASLRGRLLKSNGKPLPYTEIELVPVDSDIQLNDGRLMAISTASGRFSFIDVPDGKYTLSINFDEKPTETSPYPTYFYPDTELRSEADVFEFNASSRFAPVTFRLLPKLVGRKLGGRVLWENGEPVSDAFIYINDIEYNETFSVSSIKTDFDGKFTVSGFEGRKYVVGAVLFERMGRNLLEAAGPVLASNRTEIFRLDAKTPPLKIILEEPEELRRMRERNIGKLLPKF
ncbi:MAG: carboxypeptidase-like regulatory domain-containing protein [Pyrinomonadaceae bacterium]